MKLRRLISAALIIVMLAATLPGAAYAALTPAEWAQDYVRNANTSGVLTPNAAKDYQRALTRDEFCELVVLMAERVLGKELPMSASNPFTDTNSTYVQKAYQYGVINGMTITTFGPALNVQRQQLVTMMYRAIKNLERDSGKSFLKPGVTTLPFKDSAKVGAYAVEPLKVAYANEIMIGDDVGNFNPENNVTSQECVAVIIRCFSAMRSKQAEGRSNQQVVDMDYDTLELGFAYGDTINGVTQNISLATSGLGGSSISWQSSNSSVISTAGYINMPTTATSVTLTATIWLGSASRTKTFTVTTSPYRGDRLIVENAYSALDIIYLNDDSADAVTGRIYLPDTVLGVPVKWATSNSAVVTTGGAVSVPTNDEVRTVTLTATITKGSDSRVKTFTLKVINALYKSKGAALHGVELGMTPTQVTAALGTVRRTIAASSTESWQLYHTNYSNFIAVAFIGGKAVEVYSMASNASNSLTNASSRTTVTVTEVNAMNGLGAVAYSDQSGAQYAVMLYDTNSAIMSSRSLLSDGQEQLLYELINAYRHKYGLSTLTFNTKLGDSARAHSTDMSSRNYLDNKSYGTNNEHKERAAAKGYDSTLVGDGYVLGGTANGGYDVIGLFGSMVSSSTVRPHMVKTATTTVGLGFVYSGSGTNRTYLTYVFGTVIPISSVASNPATITVAPGATLPVTLTIGPTNRNETYTIASSDTNYLTISSSTYSTTANPSFNVTGVRIGSAEITITGNSSGVVHRIPVTVGTNYASSLALYYGTTALTTSSTTTTASTSEFLNTRYGTIQLSASVYPTNANVTWSSSAPSVASVSSTGLVTCGSTGGTAIIYASVTNSLGQTISHSVKVNVVVVTAASYSVATGATQTYYATTFSGATGVNYSWTVIPSPAGAVSIDGSATSSQAVIRGNAAGSGTVSCQVSRTGWLGSPVLSTASVTVTGPAAPTLTLSATTLDLYVGETRQVTATTTNPAGQQVNWSGTDAVASVSSGLISALSAGTTTITATIDGTTTSKSVTVNVHALPTIAITGGNTIAVEGTLALAYTPTLLSDCTAYWAIDTSTSTGLSIHPGTGAVTAALGATGSASVTVTIYRGAFLVGSATTTVSVT